jgi:peptidyl-prolyl cis-trans isomerase-like 4
MSALLETYWGDVVIDLDVEASPVASRNFLKLVKARQYTQCLVYRIHREATTRTSNEEGVDEGKVVIACTGCPRGNGKGGASIDAYLAADMELRDGGGAAAADVEGKVEASSVRFFKSKLAGRGVHAHELVKGDVVALCVDNIPDTIGSQFGIVVESTHRVHPGEHPSSSSSGSSPPMYVSLGKVAEDDAGVLDQLAGTYCDDDNAASSLGRPLVDIRVVRALVVDDPFADPPGLAQLMQRRGVVLEKADNCDNESSRVLSSPSPDRPPTEAVSERVPVHEVEDELDEEKLRVREELALQKEDKGRAIVLEMLGDLPDADIRAPENVLFVCKLNPVTQDEDLELIFSRFDPAVKVDIIRDHETGASLQYAFAEFATQAQAAEAYFKMNNALVDDRRIKVDFSQSVATIWDKYRQRMRRGGGNKSSAMPKLGPSFDASRTRNGNGGGGGGDDRRRDHYSRDGKSQSRRFETNARISSEGQPSRQHRDDPRHDRSRGESRSSSRQIEGPRSRFGANEERDEFGRVKGWDSRNGGGNGDARRDERHGYSTSRRERDEERSSVRHYGDDQRLDSRRDDGGRGRRDYRDRDGDRTERRLEARHEHQSEQRRYDDNRNSRRAREEIAPRDRDNSPPANGRSRGEEKLRRHDSESPASGRRDRRRSESIESDTDTRSSRRHRKRKKDKRKHHKKRKHRAYSDDEDEEPDDDRREGHKRDEKHRTKRSKHRVDHDRSSDDESSRKHAKHRERKRSRRSRSRSRS